MKRYTKYPVKANFIPEDLPYAVGEKEQYNRVVYKETLRTASNEQLVYALKFADMNSPAFNYLRDEILRRMR